MPLATDRVPAPERIALIGVFNDAIQAEPDPQRKAALGAAIGQLQSDLIGVTWAEATQAQVHYLAVAKAQK